MYCNANAPGNNLPTPEGLIQGIKSSKFAYTTADFRDCIDQCVERSDDCVGASWTPYRTTSNCYLKSKIANFSSTPGRFVVHTAVFPYKIHSIVHADKDVIK